MARRVQDIDSDIDSDAPSEPTAPVVQAETPIATADPPPVTAGNVLGGGVFTTGGGGTYGGGILSQNTGTYAPVNENDTFNGTAGDDVFHGGNGEDLIFGFAGKDALFGDAGADFIAGGLGDDWIDGGSEADILFGEAGKDTLVGGSGNDQMNGGAEDDRLFGDGGADRMTGGTGNDAFFAGTPEFGANGAVTVAKDTITDFHTRNGEEDILFLHEPVSMLTDFHERFGGNALPSMAVQHGYVQFVTHGNPLFGDYGTTVYVDSNGDQAGGERWAVAELEGVGLSDLHFGLPGAGGNLYV